MPSTPRLKTLIELLFSTARVLRKQSCRQHQPGSPSFLHLKTLHFIAHHDHCMMSHLSEELCISPSSATSLVDNLTRSGQIERINHPEDRRVVHIQLTPKGTETLANGIKSVKSHLALIFAQLNETEQTQLIHILEKLTRLYE